jgi:hypothetical protein
VSGNGGAQGERSRIELVKVTGFNEFVIPNSEEEGMVFPIQRSSACFEQFSLGFLLIDLGDNGGEEGGIQA